MKIAQCLEQPLGLRGGVSIVVETLAMELAQRGHKIILVSPDTPEGLRELKADQFIEQHVFWNGDDHSISGARKLAGQLAASGTDVAHFHGGTYGWGNRLPFHSPMYFLRRMGIPCFSTVHLAVSIFDGYCGPQKPAWLKLALLPLAWSGKLHQLRHTTCEVAVSQHDFQKLRRWYWPLRRRFIQIYHSRLSGAPRSPKENRAPIILNVGHIAWRKGQAVLAEAFVRFAPRKPEWVLKLAGPYTHESAREILRLIERCQLPGRIQLLGERSDAIELMRSAAIYVQPSFWEGLPLALQEAMFAGCSCIGARVGGISELIQHGQNGMLFEPGNVDQLAQSLERLVDDPAHREELGRTASVSIRERGMTVEKMLARHLELYDAIRR